ncbi:hypothetical protein EMPS_10794 [Entomortierella parvispora]|uniref:Uncharacterized protein n=1 Tax=Entomortierella parvispora TaxID=205924 RepID=A0A9P3HKJ6_9FUNG|nr:hypothetical protein EMPS_10794 [Entomortierella parvispora]
MKRASKQYYFEGDHRSVHVKVLELLDPNFGLYVWPSSLVLAEYIFDRLDLFQASLTPPPAKTISHTRPHAQVPSYSPKIVLELGAGTALPTLLLAKATNPRDTFLIATDRPDVPSILENIREALKENQIPVFDRSSLIRGQQQKQRQRQQELQKQSLDTSQEHDLSSRIEAGNPRVEVRGLGWGDFTFSEDSLGDQQDDKEAASRGGGLLQLLEDVGQSVFQEREGSLQPGRIDILLGSDTFYNPPDFEPLLSTVAYIIHRHNPDCVFLTSYQNRSTKRNIDHLLRKWDLEGREIDWQEFGFDTSKYVADGDDDLEGYPGSTGDDDDLDPLSDQGARHDSEDEDDDYEDTDEVREGDGESGVRGKSMDHWMKLAKQEIENQVQSSVNGLSPSPHTAQIATATKISPLVNYGSSGSDDEDEPCLVARPQLSAKSTRGTTDDVDQSDSDFEVKPEAQSQDHPTSSHQLGDGGALNSVHLLWICKRGRAESLFESWRSKKST